MKKGFVLFLVFLMTLVSCSQMGTPGVKRRETTLFQSGTETTRYFLPDLPGWANVSQSANCHRTSQTRYFNLRELRNSFDLSYEQALQLQYMFNHQEKNIMLDANANYLPFKDEEKLFYDVSDRIRAGIKQFRKPTFKRVHLIWIDLAIQDDSELNKLKKLMKSSVMDKGHPVFVSLCLDYFQMSQFITKNNFPDQIRVVPVEMFSPYDTNNNLTTSVQIEFDKIFDANQELYLFLPHGEGPREFVGKFKTQQY